MNDNVKPMPALWQQIISAPISPMEDFALTRRYYVFSKPAKYNYLDVYTKEELDLLRRMNQTMQY
jgi:hypothetical protein